MHTNIMNYVIDFVSRMHFLSDTCLKQFKKERQKERKEERIETTAYNWWLMDWLAGSSPNQAPKILLLNKRTRSYGKSVNELCRWLLTRSRYVYTSMYTKRVRFDLAARNAVVL